MKNRFYRGCYRIARVLFGLVYRFEINGQENIPKGAAMVCANHSNVIDPIMVAFAFGVDCQVHFIAKVELFRIPVLATVVRKLGAISINRGALDIASMKNTLNHLKHGDKVVIFPEGTRMQKADAAAAKAGAVRIAERAGVPLVPFYLPRKKPLFSKVKLVIGAPYLIEKQPTRRNASDYAGLVELLMSKIEALDPSKQMIRSSKIGARN